MCHACLQKQEDKHGLGTINIAQDPRNNSTERHSRIIEPGNCTGVPVDKINTTLSTQRSLQAISLNLFTMRTILGSVL
jgi:hypothetical protein